MTRRIERTINTNDTAVLSIISLNAATSTTISTVNSKRLAFILSNTSPNDIFIKLQAASIDDIQKGICVSKLGGIWEMKPDSIYTGEISAIAANDAPSVFITEY